MSKKLKLLVDLLSYDSIKPTNDPSVDSLRASNTIETVISEISRVQKSIPDLTTDQVIMLVDSESDLIAILTDQEVTIKLNGSSDSITLTPPVAGVKTLCFLSRGEITEASISNNSGNIASVDIITANI